MPTRLATVSPSLDAMLAAGDSTRCARAALAAAYQAADVCGLADAFSGLALTVANLDKIDALALAFDDEHFSLQQQTDRGVTPEVEYITSFARARAASAVAFALRGNACEAIYEAIVATDDAAGVTRTVTQVLRQDA